VLKSNPLTIQVLKLLSDGRFHSAASLAQAAGLNPNRIWAALREAGQYGAPIMRVHGQGYRLAAPIDWLEPSRIQQHLGPHARLFDITVVEVDESTNTTLLNKGSEGARSGTVLAAELQTHGRGRRGRAWHTGIGGALTFSVLWRFDQGAGVLAGLGPAVGVALVRALRALGATEVMLKWPNDVLFQHQKIAGTLIEIQGDVLGPSVAVIGIGINFRLDRQTRELIDQAVSDLVTAGVTPDRNRVLGHLLVSLVDMLQSFTSFGFAPLRKVWESYHLYANRPVSVRLADGAVINGVVGGVGDDGALLLQTDSGLRRFHSGEVSMRSADPRSYPRPATGTA
jgi:BirA family biotin operon repressor/biotin-[acetyl-CoA-carboxylase] ligase